MHGMRKLAVRVFPWLIAATMLSYLFWKTPIYGVVTAFRSASSWTLPIAILCQSGIFLGDSYAIKKTLSWFVVPLRFSDVLVVRGASYLLAAVNYNVGQGAIVYFVHRIAQVPVVNAIGTILLIMGANVLLLLGFTTVGLFAATDVPQGVGIVVMLAYLGLLAYVGIIISRPRWLRERTVFNTLMRAGIRGHISAMLVRVPHLTALLIFHYAMLRAFGIVVPFAQAILTLPIVFFIGVLPISVQGLGTSQVAAVLFFSRYSSGPLPNHDAAVLAYSLCAQAIGLAFQCLLGLVCLHTRSGQSIFNNDSRNASR